MVEEKVLSLVPTYTKNVDQVVFQFPQIWYYHPAPN